MTNDESATIAEIKVQYSFIVESLREIKDALTLREGTPLRDSMTVLVDRQIREKEQICATHMQQLTDHAILAHEQSAHARRRNSTPPEPKGVISDVAKERAKFWGVVTALLGLVAERFLNQ